LAFGPPAFVALVLRALFYCAGTAMVTAALYALDYRLRVTAKPFAAPVLPTVWQGLG
jgi:hypothetical protein